MKEILTLAAQYAGELLIAGVAIVVRSIEKKLMIRKNRKRWESGEQYSRINRD
jgi:hypothetical protein